MQNENKMRSTADSDFASGKEAIQPFACASLRSRSIFPGKKYSQIRRPFSSGVYYAGRVSETVKRETSTGESPSEIYSEATEDWLSEVFSQQWTPNSNTLQNVSTDVESSPYDTELKEIASKITSQSSSINLTKISKSTRYLEDLPHPSRLRLKGRPERKVKQFNVTTDISCHLSQLRRKEKYCLGDVQNEFRRARKDFLDLQRHRRLGFEKFKDTMNAVPLDSLQEHTTLSSAGTFTCLDATDQYCIQQGDEWQNQSLRCHVARSDLIDKIDPLSFYKAPTLGTESCPNGHSIKSDTSQANLWTQNQRILLNPKELDISPKSTTSYVSLGHNDFNEHGEMLNPQNVHHTGRRTIFEDLSVPTDDIPGIYQHSLSDSHIEYMGCAERIGQHLIHKRPEPCCGDDASNPIFDQTSFWKTPVSAGGQHVEDEFHRSNCTHIQTKPIIKDQNFKYELCHTTEGDPFTTPSRRIADIEYDEIHHDTSGSQGNIEDISDEEHIK